LLEGDTQTMYQARTGSKMKKEPTSVSNDKGGKRSPHAATDMTQKESGRDYHGFVPGLLIIGSA
jgi:hypothetical protein